MISSPASWKHSVTCSVKNSIKWLRPGMKNWYVIVLSIITGHKLWHQITEYLCTGRSSTCLVSTKQASLVSTVTKQASLVSTVTKRASLVSTVTKQASLVSTVTTGKSSWCSQYWQIKAGGWKMYGKRSNVYWLSFLQTNKQTTVKVQHMFAVWRRTIIRKHKHDTRTVLPNSLWRYLEQTEVYPHRHLTSAE